MQSIGERLKQARLAAGMSQRALAKLAEPLSAMAVSRYENGQDTPGSDVLLRLAKALGLKFEYFFRPVTVSLANVEYRKRSRFSAKQVASIEHRALDQIERYLAAEDLFGPDAFPPLPACDASSIEIRTLKDAERAADALREQWDIGDDSIKDLCEVLEDRGVKVILVDTERGFDGFKAWATRNGDSIPIIGVRRDREFGDRQRLSMAHELGHLVLTFAEGTDEKFREKAAYRFAAAFLVPERAVRRQFPTPVPSLSLPVLYSLKHKWGISMSAWARRLSDLSIISESTYRRFCIYLNGQRNSDGSTWWEREPHKQVTPEIPRRFNRLVEQAVAQDILSPGRAADLLGKPLAEVRREMKWPTEANPV